MTREGFLPQITLRGVRLGQNGEPAPAPSPAPSPSPSPAPSGDGGDGGDGRGRFFPRFPFFPAFYNVPSVPFYWQQPYPVAPARPRYICKKTEDEEGEERFICEQETPPPAPPAPVASFYPRPSLFYVRPYVGSWFF